MKFKKVYIEISNVCNLQCHFCPEVLRPKKLMDKDFFRKIVNEVRPYTDTITLHLMGEPLAHPQFRDMLSIIKEVGLQLHLTSNGFLIERHQDALLDFSPASQINFSIHSFFDNHPAKDIEPYLTKLVHFGRGFLRHHPEAFINFRLWNLPAPSAEQTLHNQKIFDVLRKTFEAPELPDEVSVKEKKSYRLERHFKLHFDTEFIWPQLSLPTITTQGSCYGLQSQIAVLADGTLVPCCLDKEAGIALGSLHDSPLADLLNTDRAKNIIRGFQSGRLVEPLCQKCQFRTRFDKKPSPIREV